MEDDGMNAPFPLPPVSSSPIPATATSTEERGREDKEGETTDVWRGITERGGRGSGSNGQSDERCAIIASAKIGSRQDAAGGNITFRGGAQKP